MPRGMTSSLGRMGRLGWSSGGKPPVLPLDNLTAAAAWSVRKLLTAYAGQCLRLRRSTDDAESDFGFVANGLDTASITTWLNGATGYIRKWYDQSGHGNDLGQSTKANQPTYTAAGTGSKPTITLSGNPVVMTAADSDSLDLTSTFLINVVVAPASATPASGQKVINKTGAYALGYLTTGKPEFTTLGVLDYDSYLIHWPASGLQQSVLFDASQDASFYYNSSYIEKVAGSVEPTVSTGTFYLGAQINNLWYIGAVSELILVKPAPTGTTLDTLMWNTAHYYSLPVAVTPDNAYVTATYQQQLTIPTYDGSGDIIHIDVVDTGAGLINGYRYWMAMTPYPNSDSDYENPSIVASNDKTSWVVPAGLTNPVIAAPGGGAYNSDPDLILGQDGLLWMFYRVTKAATNDKIYVTSSADGVTWSAPVLILDVANNTAICPSIIWDGTQYKMWVNASGGTNFKYYTCATPDGAWSAATACFIDSGSGPLHFNVIKRDCEYHMFGTNAGVTFLRSLDGKDWYQSTNKIEAEGYRAAGVWNGAGYDLWYTTGGAHSKVKLATVTVPV